MFNEFVVKMLFTNWSWMDLVFVQQLGKVSNNWNTLIYTSKCLRSLSPAELSSELKVFEVKLFKHALGKICSICTSKPEQDQLKLNLNLAS